MTDGTVLVFDYCGTNVYKLTPDQSGNYVTGTWTQVASLPSGYAPLYFASAVLPDGKLIVNGGEYNFCSTVESTVGAIYDPVANTWTSVSAPTGWSRIGDGESVVLPNGTYMIGNCCSSVQAQLNESTMAWTQVGNGKADTNSEEGWSLLPGRRRTYRRCRRRAKLGVLQSEDGDLADGRDASGKPHEGL